MTADDIQLRARLCALEVGMSTTLGLLSIATGLDLPALREHLASSVTRGIAGASAELDDALLSTAAFLFESNLVASIDGLFVNAEKFRMETVELIKKGQP